MSPRPIPRVLAIALAPLGLLACKGDTDIVAQKRCLTTDQATWDAGIVAINDRRTLKIPLSSACSGPVTLYNVYTEEEDAHWEVLDTWKGEAATESSTPVDSDEDGTMDALTIDGGSEEEPSYGLLEVSFRPTESEGYFRQILILESNDSEVQEHPEDDPETEEKEDTHGLWKISIRGIGAYPCGIVYPEFFDFGPRAAGGAFSVDATVENCGIVMLTVASFEIAGSTSYYVDTNVPVYVLPASTQPITVTWIPVGEIPESATVGFTTNDPAFAQTVTLIGNTCDGSSNPAWDEDADGYSSCNWDACGPTDPDTNPNAQEIPGDGLDNDCDSAIDEAADSRDDDYDQDFVTENGGDCNDNTAAVGPTITEIPNGIDDDCDGLVDEGSDHFDDDGDGYTEVQGDCDDASATVHPGADENENTVDDDCDTLVDEGSYYFDDDGDGFAEIQEGSEGGDCDDGDPWAYPGALEDCDERDNDCDDEIDEANEGTDDVDACEFQVERSTTPTDPGGCATAVPSGGLGVGLGGLVGVLVRRRRT